MWRKTLVKLVIILPLLFLLVGFLLPAGGPYEVRIDTGDMRTRLFGRIPMPSFGLESTDRVRIVSAANRLGIGREWHPVVRKAPSNPTGSIGFYYERAAIWLEIEPPLGERILKDIAAYVRDQRRPDGLSHSAAFLHSVRRESGQPFVDLERFGPPEYLVSELEELGYVPVPGGPVDAYLKSVGVSLSHSANDPLLTTPPTSAPSPAPTDP